ncbi:MAG: hypothetical protein ACSLE6_04405 [Mycobacterium sp.]
MSLHAVRPWLIAAAVAAALVGCSSDEPAEQSPTSTTSEHGGYAHCLSEHGITTPPAGPGAPPGVDEETWREAQEACATLAPGPNSQ